MLKISRISICAAIFFACLSVQTFSADKIYLGVFDNDKTKNLDDLSGVETFERDAGKKVAIIHVFQAWGAKNGKNQFNVNAMNAIRSHGSIPLLTWAPRALHEKENEPEYALKNIINGKYDGYIIKFASDIKGWKHPLFLRFAHEMNGNWYPWAEGVNGNVSGEYVKAWHYVHDLFKRNQVTNVTWVWCPSRKNSKHKKLSELYPGDDYVDWLGIDGYNDTRFKGWQSFAEVFGGAYHEMAGLSGKPIMIAEFSSMEAGGKKSVWISKTLSSTITAKFPRIKAVIWLNHKFSSELDWRIESSVSSQRAFAESVASPLYCDNKFGSLDVSPISAP
ncbi:MAG: hypothetical protein HQM08_07800 [Candidatus Riflebacteria bacterium]|nr:hypothetical protein [Candidatus Riflebacteria bacterium]